MSEGILRCGLCWRNLATAWGRYYHTVWQDGSLRCYDVDADSGGEGGHCVLDVPELRDAVRRYVKQHMVNDERVAPRVEVEPGV
jgi:hypothetical protein